MPIISDKIPGPCKGLKAGDIMAKDVICINEVETVSNIQAILRSPHHAFPVINSKRKMTGIVPRNFIIILL
jgi:CBS-domain-containing membrane protein